MSHRPSTLCVGRPSQNTKTCMIGEDFFSHQSALSSTKSNVPGSFSGFPVARKGSCKLFMLPRAQEKPRKLDASRGCATTSSRVDNVLSSSNDKLGSGTLSSIPCKPKKESSLTRLDPSYVFSERLGSKTDGQHQPGLAQCREVPRNCDEHDFGCVTYPTARSTTPGRQRRNECGTMLTMEPKSKFTSISCQ